MALNNSLAKAAKTTATTKKNEVKFIANGAEVTLTPETVKNYLVSGDKDKVTMQEVVMFINLCKFNGLNPWLKEAYCIKYGTEPATIVPAKDAFMKRAESNPDFDGYKAGLIIYDEETGELTYREGSMLMKHEVLAGGYAEVYRKDRTHPYRAEVSFDEYAGKKKDGTLNRQWGSKPATMIRKVALVQALREAFPSNLGGMYTAEEQGVDEPIDVTYSEVPEQPIEAEPEQPETPAEAPQNDAQAALFGN